MRNALAVVALMFLVLLIIGCGQKSANSPSQLISGEGEGFQSENQTPIRGGPAPVYLEFSAVPEYQDYDQGDSVHFSISIKNVSTRQLPT